jgi:hypothetical protein
MRRQRAGGRHVRQALMKPAYVYVEGQVGKEFMARLRTSVQAASK